MNPHAWPESWALDREYVRLYRRLLFQYGEERATAITEGADLPTNADLDAWRRLCAAPEKRRA